MRARFNFFAPMSILLVIGGAFVGYLLGGIIGALILMLAAAGITLFTGGR